MSTEQENNFWKKCSSCKKGIAFGAKYYLCSVSSCNGQRTGYVFCSVPCFEVHLPGARHKDAAAMEERAPMRGASFVSSSFVSSASSASPAPLSVSPPTQDARPPQRTIVRPQTAAPREVLVVASRLKEYITARGDMNTSGSVMDVLSEHLRAISDRAIENARADGRKTVMDRDFQFLKGKL